MTEPITYTSLVSTFADFLIAAIHTILYERQIYPRTSFLSARKYNFPVRQSRHPKVCTWIADAVAAVEAEMLDCAVERVAVVIFSQQSQPLERFMFDMSRFPVVGKEDITTPIENAVSIVNLEEQFRAVMSKLSVCGSSLKPLPEGCSFTVAIELKDEADAPIGHPQPWIPTQPSLQREICQRDTVDTQVRRGKDLGGVRTTPLRAVDAGDVVFEMWIEEGQAKAT
ncbi:DNA-binding protein [Trichodelitschia bisporula]|uniref:DNA-binding protein n=1 Tax=Trichodelitschia bisporula TaxID=703511 RepID=A0A6G1HZ06_9PEZI|nr:DNA-binding protein [Trichodelitschia bisporula]